MGRLGWNSGYIGSDQRTTPSGSVSYSKFYLERLDGRFLPVLDIDPDAQAFFGRVTAAGGTLSSTEQNAINQLVVDMKSYGIWTAMKAIYPMVGASAAACAQNLKSSSFTGTFNGGWTFSTTGATPNGTSGYMNTNLNPNSVFGLGYASNGSYFRTTFTAGQTNINGVTNGTQRFDFGYDNGVLAPFNAIGSNSSDVGTDTDNRGFLLSTRQGASVVKLFRNNVLKINGSQTFTSYPSLNYFVAARNLNGTPQLLSNMGSLAFHIIGDGLSDTEASNFYNAVQAFQTTLSRQV